MIRSVLLCLWTGADCLHAAVLPLYSALCASNHIENRNCVENQA